MKPSERYRGYVTIVVFNPDNDGDVIAKKASAVIYRTRRSIGNIVAFQPTRYVVVGKHRLRVTLDSEGKPVARLTKQNFLRLFPA